MARLPLVGADRVPWCSRLRTRPISFVAKVAFVLRETGAMVAIPCSEASSPCVLSQIPEHKANLWLRPPLVLLACSTFAFTNTPRRARLSIRGNTYFCVFFLCGSCRGEGGYRWRFSTRHEELLPACNDCSSAIRPALPGCVGIVCRGLACPEGVVALRQRRWENGSRAHILLQNADGETALAKVRCSRVLQDR